MGAHRAAAPAAEGAVASSAARPRQGRVGSEAFERSQMCTPKVHKQQLALSSVWPKGPLASATCGPPNVVMGAAGRGRVARPVSLVLAPPNLVAGAGVGHSGRVLGFVLLRRGSGSSNLVEGAGSRWRCRARRSAASQRYP